MREFRRNLSTPVALLLLLTLVLAGAMLTGVAMVLLTATGLVSVTERSGLLLITTIQDILVFILPALALAAVLWREPLAGLYLKTPPSWLAVAIVVVMQVASLPLMNSLVDWNSHVHFPEAMERALRAMEDAAAVQIEVLLHVDTLWQMLVGVLVIGFMAALSEEMLFRGAILGRWLDDEVSTHVAVWAVAILFSAIHLQFYGFVPRMVLGAWLGYLLVWTRSLWVPIIAHMLNNSIVVVASWLDTRGVIDVDAIDAFGVVPSGEFPWNAFFSLMAAILIAVLAARKLPRADCVS